MKNTGMANYSAVVNNKFKNIAEIFINPIPETWNTHYIIPLYKSKYKRGLELSLIYNHQEMWTDNNFGKGLKLNCDVRIINGDNEYPYYYVKANGQKFGLKLVDSIESIFYYQYENKELNILFSIYRDQFNIYYKDGTILNLIGLNNCIAARKLTKKDGTIINYTRDANGRIVEIQNNAFKPEKIEINYNSNDYILFSVQKTDKTNEFREVRSIKLFKHTSGTFAGFVNKVLISPNVNSSYYIKNIELSHSANGSGLQTYRIIDKLSNQFCEFQVNAENRPNYYQDELGRKTTFFNYGQFCANVINYKGECHRLHTDYLGRITSVTNDLHKKVKSFSYDENNKMVQLSKELFYNPRLNGQVINMSYDNVNSHMTKQSISTPAFLSEFYSSSKTVRINSTNNLGKYAQVFSLNGNKFDTVSLGVWSKFVSSSSLDDYVIIDIYFVKNNEDYTLSKKFSKQLKIHTKQDEFDYEFSTISAYSLQKYDSIIVEVKTNSDNMTIDLLFDLYKKGLTTIHEFDNNGNEVTMLNSSKITGLTYNGDNTISSTSYTNYDYDDKGNLVKTVNAFGKEELFEYDNSNNLLKHTITDGTKKIVSEFNYIDEENVSFENNDINITTNYDYNNVYLKSKDYNFYDSAGNIINKKLQYDENYTSLLKGKIYTKNYNPTNSSSIEYEFNNSHDLKSIKHNGEYAKYENIFDEYGRVYGLKVNGTNYITNTFKKFNNLPTDLIEKLTFADKDSLIYNYDSFDRIQSISYEINNVERTLFTYNYSDDGKLESMNDLTTNTIYSYEYDDFGNLNSFSYKYNNDDSCSFKELKVTENHGAINFKQIITPTNLYNFSLQTIFKSLNTDFYEYKNSLRNTSDIYLCMFDEYVVKYKNSNSDTYTKYEQYIKLLNNNNKKCYVSTLGNQDSPDCKKDGFLTYYYSVYNNGFTFDFSNDNLLSNHQSIAFSVQPLASFGDSTLLKLDDLSNVLKLSINSSGNIIVKENSTTIFTTPKTYLYSNYHFVCLTYDIDEKKVVLKIDDDEYNIQLSCDYTLFRKLSFIELLACGLTNIIIPKNRILTNIEYNDFYKSFIYLLVLNQSRQNSDSNIVKKSSKKFSTALPYGFIPLNNGTSGIDIQNHIISPNIDEIMDLSCLSSKNSEFIYNDKIEDFAYFAMGQYLSYNVGLSNSGSLSINLNRFICDDENVLFSLMSDNNNDLALSIKNNNLCLSFDGTEYLFSHNNLLNEKNKWNVITLTWSKLVSSTSINENTFNICVYINKQNIFDRDILSQRSLSNLILNLGRYNDNTEYGCCFNGFMENLLFTNQQLSLDKVSEIVDFNHKENKIVREFDNLDLIKKLSIVDNGTTILQHNYTYQTDSLDNSRILMNISNENINNSSYYYEYDKMKNVSRILLNGMEICSYKYDELGRLIEENIGSNIYKYIYDVNGNIQNVSKNNSNLHSYLYDSTYKDKLIEFDNEVILYDLNNKFNPISIGLNKTLKYEGRNLVEYSDSSKSIHNKYYYNNQGYRILKEEYDSNNLLRKTTKYYYDSNNKLVFQDDGLVKLTFIYDDLGQIYGFIYDNKKYYYLKNIFNTILGIIDELGNIVVKYEYDAWGNILNIDDESNNSLSSINPIIYKAYYYDEDIKMYYCKSRYYVPEWRRWLNADNPNYLDCGETNSLNLYSYCGNNPLTRYDSIGRFWNIVIGAVVGAVINAAVTAVVSYVTEGKVDLVDVLLSAATGAVAGGLAAAGVPAGVALIVNGAASSTANIIDASRDGDLTVHEVGASIVKAYAFELITFGFGKTSLGSKVLPDFTPSNIYHANDLYDTALKELREHVIDGDLFTEIATETGDIVMKEIHNFGYSTINSAGLQEIYDKILSVFEKDE